MEHLKLKSFVLNNKTTVQALVHRLIAALVHEQGKK